MRVFVFEFLTAKGIGSDPRSPDHGMYREGRAMRDAVANDLLQIAGNEVVQPSEAKSFEELVAESDWTIVIAPESEGILHNLAAQVRQSYGRLLGCSEEAISLTSDKLAMANHWRERGILTPATTDREPTACEAFPLVWKPRDGAGSTATFRLDSALDVARAKASLAGQPSGERILQEWVAGQPASVAFLCGPNGQVPMMPALQTLSMDGRFRYLGGELPIELDLRKRVLACAQRAVECVPGLCGYVGVDMVLGNQADGSKDYVIEINPRLTTSYVGLRHVAKFNLAEMMLRVAQGLEPGPLEWKTGALRFEPGGAVTWL